MLLRLAYLGITNAFTLLRLLPGGDRNRDIEILSLRDQLAVVQRQLDGQRVRFEPVARAWLAALLHPLPRPTPHAAVDPSLGAAPGEGEHQWGVSEGAWRTAHARDQGRPVHRLGDPAPG